MKWKYKLLILVVLVIGIALTVLLGFPRAASFVMSYRKTCKVLRIEQFSKALIMNSPAQANKFAIICEDGSICRAEDSGWAAIKPGDNVEFRGFPEYATFEEFGKCDHAQIIKYELQK